MVKPQASNFKRKAELFVKLYLAGPENTDYRSIIKKLTEATWDYASKITHSINATFYEASTCVTLCTSLVGVYENIRQKFIAKFEGGAVCQKTSRVHFIPLKPPKREKRVGIYCRVSTRK